MKVSVLLLVVASFLAAYFYSQSLHANIVSVPNRLLPTFSPTPTDIDLEKITSENVLEYVQEYRISQKKSPYIHSKFLCKIANIRLNEVVTDWSHNKFIADRFCESKCFIGENLSKNGRYADIVVSGWLSSPPHKAALDRNFTHTCIATDGNYVVQIFGFY